MGVEGERDQEVEDAEGAQGAEVLESRIGAIHRLVESDGWRGREEGVAQGPDAGQVGGLRDPETADDQARDQGGLHDQGHYVFPVVAFC